MLSIKVHFTILLLFVFYTSAAENAYTIPSVTFENLENGFKVYIPDSPGISSVFYSIEINQQCPSYMDYVVAANNDSWSTEQSPLKLKSGDNIVIFVMVQHLNEVYKKTENITINNVGNGVVTTMSNVVKLSEAFDADNCLAAGTSLQDLLETYNKPKEQEETIDVTKWGQGDLAFKQQTDEDRSCINTITTMQNKDVCRGDLIFEENFDEGLNSNRWQYEVRLPLDNGDSEFVMYHDDEQNIKVENGLLRIVPTLWNDDRPGTNMRRGNLDLLSRCTGKQNPLQECKRQPAGSIFNILPPIVSARINTKDKFSFKYGSVEIRAKIPHGDWLFPLLLLDPLTNNYGFLPYASGQIRIAFARGNDQLTSKEGDRIDGATLYGGAILAAGSDMRDKFLHKIRRSTHFGNDFHVYKMIWTNQNITMQVDDEVYGTIVGGFSNDRSAQLINKHAWKNGDFMAPLDQEFFITIGVAAGGHVDFPDQTASKRTKPWDNTSPRAAYDFWNARATWKTTWTSPALEVDYVRVYAV